MTTFDNHTEKVQKQFNRQASAYAQTKQARDVRAMAGLVKLTHANASSQTLDVACGPGRLTAAFAQQVAQASGLDATENLLAIARKETLEMGITNIEFTHGSALAMPYPDATFDVVSCRAAFHHFAEPGPILKEMARVMKPSGQILIADILGNSNSVFAQNHDYIEQLCDASHVQCLSSEAFDALFQSVGLQAKKTHVGSADYELETWLVHGGPDEVTADKIRQLMQENQRDDQTGLRVRVEDGVLKFSHQTVVYVLEIQRSKT